MGRRYAMAVLMILGLAALTSRADDFWIKKDWKTWSKSECKKMLEESPWAKRILVENHSSDSALPLINADPKDTPGVQISYPGAGDIVYFAQLVSAAPVRAAFIRRRQIERKFDKMSETEKAAFDAQMEKELSFIKENTIAFRVVFEANKPALADAADTYWRNLPTNSVPPDTLLINEKGGTITPLTFTFIKGSETEIDLAFPRSVRAQAVIAEDAKSMKLQFPHPKMGDFPERNVTVEFKLDKMMWNGKVAY
jgi:hypothetical protein